MRARASGRSGPPLIPATPARRATILLVDDDDRARRSLKCALERAGFRVVEARGGGHALRMCEWVVGGIDMLIAEVAVSAPNGVALAEAVSAWWPRVAVVLMSDGVVAALTQFPRAQTVQRVLRRPVPCEQLVEAARRALGTR